MKNIIRIFSENKAQASTEYGLFVLAVIIACYGAMKLFTSAWAAKFKFVSLVTGVFNAFF